MFLFALLMIFLLQNGLLFDAKESYSNRFFFVVREIILTFIWIYIFIWSFELHHNYGIGQQFGFLCTVLTK